MKVIRSKRNRNGILAILVAGVLSTALVNLAQAAPKADNSGLSHRVSELESTSTDSQARIEALESANTDSQAKIEALESLVRRLHRQSAAVIGINTGGGSSNPFTSVTYNLTLCTQEAYELNGFVCPPFSPDLVAVLTEVDEGKIFTFTAANEPDFAAIVALLTNGEDDRLEEFVFTGQGGGGGTSADSIYFRDFTGPGAVDLSGFSINRISLAVDVMNIFAGGVGTQYTLKGRLFFELGE